MILGALLGAGTVSAQSVPYERWQGTHGGPPKAQAVPIQSASDWKGIWAMYLPHDVPPPFDPARHMGLAVAIGQKPSTGYAIDVVDVGPSEGRFVIRLKEIEPVDPAAGQAMTSPWLILKFARTNMPIKVEGIAVAPRKR
jgi:hypothetical protein